MEKSKAFGMNGVQDTEDEKSKGYANGPSSSSKEEQGDVLARISLPIGTVIEGTSYEIVEVLGQGGFGITYKVLDIHLGGYYALKEFFPKEIVDRDTSFSLKLNAHPNESERFKRLKSRFLSEAKALKDCDHPGIVKIFSVLIPSDLNTICYRMEYVEGVTLREKFEGHPVGMGTAISLIRKIAVPLRYMHAKRILHFDLNPNNVMLRPDGSVVLIDFGFSKQYDSTGKRKGSSLLKGGTTGYLAPELGTDKLKEFSPSADIYSLGGIFYFLLTGHNPDRYEDLVQDEDLLLADLPSKLHPFFKKAMCIQAKDRFQSVDEFCRALEEINKPKTGIDQPDSISNGKGDDSASQSSVPEQEELRGGNEDKTNPQTLEEERKKKKILRYCAAIFLVALISSGAYYIFKESKSDSIQKMVQNEGPDPTATVGDDPEENTSTETDPTEQGGSIEDPTEFTSTKERETEQPVQPGDNEGYLKEPLTEVNQPKDGPGQELLPPPPPPKSEIETLEDLYNAGDKDAAYKLGCLYKNKNNKLAFEWFEKGAKRDNHKEAMYELGECYKQHIGVDKDDKVAFKWWEKASALGSVAAKKRLANDEDYNPLQ